MPRTMPLYKMLAQTLASPDYPKTFKKSNKETLKSLEKMLPEGFSLPERQIEYTANIFLITLEYHDEEEGYDEEVFIIPSLSKDFELANHPTRPKYYLPDEVFDKLRTALYTPIPHGDD